MKLFLNAASPYARLVRVLLLETGLQARCELHYVDPWQSPPELLACNPAGKVPALVLDDGTRLAESSCIAEQLIRCSGMTHLSAFSAPHRDTRLALLGLGRAAMDCAFGAVVVERFSPENALAARWLQALGPITASLEAHARDTTPGQSVDLADLTLAVALEYVAFRLPQIPWQKSCPRLAHWMAHLAERPSLATTRPE